MLQRSYSITAVSGERTEDFLRDFWPFQSYGRELKTGFIITTSQQLSWQEDGDNGRVTVQLCDISFFRIFLVDFFSRFRDLACFCPNQNLAGFWQSYTYFFALLY